MGAQAMTEHWPNLDPSEVKPMTKRDAARKLGVSSTQLERMQADPDLDPPLPKPVPVSARRVVYLEHELAGWLLERANRRTPK